MSKKKKKIQETTIENYYDLKVDKVDELVAALKGEDTGEDVSMDISECTGETDPKLKQKQFDPYKIDKFSRIPAWVKAIFIKWWFAGLVCYFVDMGLGSYLNAFDVFVLTGVVIGIIVELFVNPIFRYMESDRKEYNAYMMFPFPLKAFWTFFANIIYYLVVVIVVNYCYSGLNLLINLIAGRESSYISVGVEPLLLGLFAVIIDMAFIGIKDAVVYGVKKMRIKKKESMENV